MKMLSREGMSSANKLRKYMLPLLHSTAVLEGRDDWSEGQGRLSPVARAFVSLRMLRLKSCLCRSPRIMVHDFISATVFSNTARYRAAPVQARFEEAGLSKILLLLRLSRPTRSLPVRRLAFANMIPVHQHRSLVLR